MKDKVLFHGSQIAGIESLLPVSSVHGKKVVCLTSNEVLAAVYSVKPVEAPYYWYPYGFDQKGRVCYNEYYENALSDIYKGKSGYIYCCEKKPDIVPLENIKDAFVSYKPCKIMSVEKLDDVYERLLEYIEQGRLVLKKFDNTNERQRSFAEKMIADEIKEHRLYEKPENPYARFLRERFHEVWEKQCENKNLK
ncbi:hypothetical protein [Ruminococcus sp. Marseille-P6503]|uniref:hypothetical protein n=1 Tax=Ruminococcus sp. Marseille-P6503 TaxID=2364796 RepID=UPI000F52A15E|nr:hypothetical protein [Ruminococcus sp. Marseille-P6503]